MQDVLDADGAGATVPDLVLEAVVAFDNLAMSESGDAGSSKCDNVPNPIRAPRVPAMGQAASSCKPPLGGGDPERKKTAYAHWRAAGLPAMEVVLEGFNHFTWGLASQDNLNLAHYYALGWFDRWLKSDPTATARLLERSNIAGKPIATRLDEFYRSAASFDGTDCPDLRSACPYTRANPRFEGVHPSDARSRRRTMIGMTYATGRTYFDADGHIMEQRDWLASYADAGVRDRLLPLMSEKVKVHDGLFAAIDKAEGSFKRRGEDAEFAAECDAGVMDLKGWNALGAFDAAERSHALDLLGFSGQLVFGSAAFGQYAYSEDADVVYGGARALNRGLAEFCSGDDRLFAVGHVPFNDAERALATTQEAIELGCQGLCLNLSPPVDKSNTHPDFDPVYASLAEAEVPFMLHVSVGTSPTSSRCVPPGYRNNGREKLAFALGGENMRALDFMAIPFMPSMTLGAMALDGVFERHPTLRGGVVEQGAMWVVPWLNWLDHAAVGFARREPHFAELTMKPSEYIRRAVKFTPYSAEPVGWMIENSHPELYLFSTDYPHPEGGRDPLGNFERSLATATEDVKDLFYTQNFRDLMGAQIPVAA